MIRKTVKLGQNMNDSLAFVQLTISCSSFYDTACAVADLNLLNSEIGRLGLAISIITGLCSWFYVFSRNLCIEATLMKSNMLLLSWISKIFMMIVILFIIRPVMSWMNRSTPEGKTLKEGYVSSILISVMGISVFSQSIGIDPTLGPLMIGLTVPVGSPIAEAVQKKLECFVTFVLLPPVYIIAGYHVQAFEVIWKNFVVLEIMMLLAYSAKIIVVILASLYFRMPIVDSFCLGLLLNCNGIFYLLYLIAMVEAELMSPQTYTIMIFTNLLLTMVITPMVKYLYDPSRKYAGYKRQTILNSAVNSELRILACVYNQENVPSILNFLETTNPITKDSCVCIYVLRLVELVGRATSVLIEHKEEKKNQYTQARSRNSSEKIINAFHRFEQQNEGYTIGQCYTAISPISSMDNDVSQIAMKKRTNLVIIPFGEFDEHPYRAVNRNVLQKSPCSVGILFDHKNGSGAVIDVSMSCHNIAMIFIGGADDREALAYSMRMADKPNLQLSVFRLTHIKPNKKTKKDDELICHLWDKIMHTENIVYKEEEVTDCADTASRIKCLEDSYDFIIVGRRHDSNSPILHGLDEWCVFKELGVIGDLFATSTFEGNFSVLAGIVLGPALLGGTEAFQYMFRDSGGMALMSVIECIGGVFLAFLVGVKTDMDMITKASRPTIVIGFCTYLIPLLFNNAVLSVVRKIFNLESNMSDSLTFVALSVTHSSFYDTACAVADLNLLNSKIGRLGLAISIVTGMSSWLYEYAYDFYVEANILNRKMLILAWISKVLLFIFIMFILRPVMSWMNKSTPEGKTLNEGYLSSILISVLGVSFCSQSIGIDPALGPLIVGLTVPVGSPIAAAVQKKLECFVTFVLVTPVYIIGGSHVRAFKFIWKDFVVVEIMVFLGYIAKVVVVMLASIYLRMPILDSFCLGLLLTCDGIYHMWYSMIMVEAEMLTQQSYTIIFFTNLLLTMVITPMVKYLYDPSRKYAGYKRQTILNSVNSELRILACVYNPENVPSILNFLEATSPVTKDSFVCLYVLHLVELVGRATSILVEHKQQKNKQFAQARNRNSSEKIINAFNQFAQQNQGFTIGQCFTAISPFSSMENDVSQIALDKRTNLVIIPFGELDEHPYRAVNRSVLGKAPCSVGILFDHKNSSRAVIDVSICFHNVAMIFIGGPDDREALAYSMRMADQPNLNLSVFRFTHIKPNKKTKKDDELISDLWDKIMNTENIFYKEEEVTDCADTASKIKCLENSYDFIIAGRRHDTNSPIVHGLDEWCVFKELGVIGDLFATSTFEGNFSVVVLQH
ncbi:hypothetical protein MKW92_028984 [Papaver armeniacum]|nr:hypothetical protein MKW92_028984 [Papaver armeniacum]